MFDAGTNLAGRCFTPLFRPYCFTYFAHRLLLVFLRLYRLVSIRSVWLHYAFISVGLQFSTSLSTDDSAANFFRCCFSFRDLFQLSFQLFAIICSNLTLAVGWRVVMGYIQFPTDPFAIL